MGAICIEEKNISDIFIYFLIYKSTFDICHFLGMGWPLLHILYIPVGYICIRPIVGSVLKSSSLPLSSPSETEKDLQGSTIKHRRWRNKISSTLILYAASVSQALYVWVHVYVCVCRLSFVYLCEDQFVDFRPWNYIFGGFHWKGGTLVASGLNCGHWAIKVQIQVRLQTITVCQS